MDSPFYVICIYILRAFFDYFVNVSSCLVDFLPLKIVFRQRIFRMEDIRVCRIPFQSQTFLQYGNSLLGTAFNKIESAQCKTDPEALFILTYPFPQLLFGIGRPVS